MVQASRPHMLRFIHVVMVALEVRLALGTKAATNRIAISHEVQVAAHRQFSDSLNAFRLNSLEPGLGEVWTTAAVSARLLPYLASNSACVNACLRNGVGTGTDGYYAPVFQLRDQDENAIRHPFPKPVDHRFQPFAGGYVDLANKDIHIADARRRFDQLVDTRIAGGLAG